MSEHKILQVQNLKVNFDVSSEGDMPWTRPRNYRQ